MFFYLVWFAFDYEVCIKVVFTLLLGCLMLWWLRIAAVYYIIVRLLFVTLIFGLFDVFIVCVCLLVVLS